MLAAGSVPEEGRTENGEFTDGTRSSMMGSSPLDELNSVRGLNSFQENGRSTLLQCQDYAMHTNTYVHVTVVELSCLYYITS